MYALVLLICYLDGGCEDIMLGVYDDEPACIVARDEQRSVSLLNFHQRQPVAKHGAGVNIVLIPAADWIIQRRMAKVKGVRASNVFPQPAL